jgi:hypothetical protein
MAWPLSQDYNEAIQSPDSSFADPELRAGQAVTNALGMPMPRSGNFADVYEFIGASGAKWAVKCFTREVAGLQERYNQIDLHLLRVKLPFSVEFQYQPGGIRIRGKWHPILKMQWVEGLLLNEFVRDNLDKPVLLGQLGLIWSRVAKRLREEGIAHADLQHGNVLLVPGSKNTSLALKLIDYDGMFVPALAKTKSGEVGHPNYQHPQRLREGIYNAEVDRFPLLVVATALKALSVGGRALWDRHDNGDNLLFRETDLQAPAKSALFKELRELSDPQTRMLVAELEKAVERKLEEVPAIDELLPETKPVSASVPSGLKAGEPAVTPKRQAAASVSTVNPLAFEDDGAPQPKRERPVKRSGVPLMALIGCGVGVGFLLLAMIGAGVLWAVLGRGKDNAQIVQEKKGAVKEAKEFKGIDKKPPINEQGPLDGKGADKKPPINEPPLIPVIPDKGQLVVQKPDVNPPVVGEFVSLFNGKDLTGWNVSGVDKGQWRVVDGILSNHESPPNFTTLSTKRADFKDFRLRLEARVSKMPSTGGDVGLRVPVNGGSYASLRFNDAMKVAGAWTVLEVIMQGDRAKFIADGKVIRDFSTAKLSPIGRLNLIIVDNGVEIRKIEFMDLNAPAAPPNVAAGDFVPLFNGTDLTGWTPPKKPGTWRVENGNLTVSASTAGPLFTVRDDFKDFHLRVEARLKAGASTVYFRHLATGESGEVNWDNNRTGRLTIRPRKGPGRPNTFVGTEVSTAAGDWISLEVIAEGNRFRVIVNGRTTTDFTDADNRTTSGRIGLRPPDGEIEIRKIEIKELNKPLVGAVSDSKRNRWVYNKGSFTNTDGKKWVEKDGERIAFRFQETARVDEYVELYRTGPNDTPPRVTVRLHADHCQMKINNGPFKELYKGTWDVSKDLAVVEPKNDLPAPGADGFVALFNGKDMTGWKPDSTRPGNWRVADGVLTGSGSAPGFLDSLRADYRDFHLRAEARFETTGVGALGGIYFRSSPEHFGYEAMINDGNKKIGHLYVRTKGLIKLVPGKPTPNAPGAWFTLEVLAQGNRVAVKVDGKTTAEYVDEKMSFTSGQISLRHFGNCVIEFRKIEIKELPAK